MLWSEPLMRLTSSAERGCWPSLEKELWARRRRESWAVAEIMLCPRQSPSDCSGPNLVWPHLPPSLPPSLFPLNSPILVLHNYNLNFYSRPAQFYCFLFSISIFQIMGDQIISKEKPVGLTPVRRSPHASHWSETKWLRAILVYYKKYMSSCQLYISWRNTGT